MADMRTWIRTGQTYFPWMLELKFDTQRALRRLRRSPFESEFKLLRHISFEPGQQCIDVGANRGQSIDAIRLYLKEAEIVAFEPNPVLATRLERRFRGDRALQVHAEGLGHSRGEFRLYIPAYRGWEFDGLASFDLESARDWLPGRIVGFDPAKLEVREFTCQVARLDDFELSPFFIKIDVQGAEHDVIVGGRETLARCRPVLLIETGPDWPIPDSLKALGYMACAYEVGTLQIGRCGARNTLFVTEERLSQLRGVRTVGFQ